MSLYSAGLHTMVKINMRYFFFVFTHKKLILHIQTANNIINKYRN